MSVEWPWRNRASGCNLIGGRRRRLFSLRRWRRIRPQHAVIGLTAALVAIVAVSTALILWRSHRQALHDAT
ncbi:MAG TPA: hypothetical protein VFQ82_13805, partial [Stellaceae bacterium]|nr:hypothetical protein [Stellaceae bacterium]